MKLRKIILIALLILSTWIPNANAASHDLHWERGTDPLIITVYDQTRNKAWGEALRKLTNKWNSGIHDIKFSYIHDPNNSSCEDGLGLRTVVACIHETSDKNYLAQANIYYQNGHIIKATIWMDPRPKPKRDSLACHELGHTLGLDHRKDGDTCMTTMDNRWISHPDEKDFQDVSLRHAHQH